MNPYAAHGITQDAATGSRILVITPNSRAIHDALEELARADTRGGRVQRTNGRSGVDYPSGGRIDLRPACGNVRGMTADTVFLDAGADLIADPAEYGPCINGRPGGRIIRA